MKFNHIVSAAAVAAAALAAPAANAAFIIGGVSFNGGYDAGALTNLPNSIVSGLNAFNVSALGGSGTGGNGDFLGLNGFGNVTTFDFDKATPPTVLFSAGGFTFNVLAFGASAILPMNCAGAQCTDTIAFSGTGVVSGNGFTPTGFTMSWTSTGTCNELGSTGTCGANANANWSASISATGSEPPSRVPEPNALALVGLALAGLAFTTRRRAGK